MLNVILLLIVGFCLSKWYYHTIIILAIWWQVLENFIIPPYTFTGVCSVFVLWGLAIKFLKKDIKIVEFPFLRAFLISFSCYFLSCVIGIFKLGTVFHALSIFVLPMASFYAVRRIRQLWIFLFVNLLVYATVILMVGFDELQNGFNAAILGLQAIGLGNYSSEQNENYIRFGMYRCQSLFVWCSTYGVACGFTAVLLLFLRFYQRLKFSFIILPIVGLLLFGMFSTGTRSVFVAVFIVLVAYLFQSSLKFKYLLVAVVALICAYNLFPDFFDEVYLSFTNESSVGGSDTNMRGRQLSVALNEFSKHPLLGNGEGRCAFLVNKGTGLLGAESFLFWILIDRGLFGLFASCYLLWSAISYVKKINWMLCLLPIGLMAGKFMSLFPHIEETYYFFYLFVILRAYLEYKNESKNNHLSPRV